MADLARDYQMPRTADIPLLVVKPIVLSGA